MRTRVLHLAGSPTSAFWAELSRVYALDCVATTAVRTDIEPVLAWIEPGGLWRFPSGFDPAAVSAAAPVELREALGQIDGDAIDVVVPHLFCPAGMTDYRALLSVAGLDFVGNTAAAMAAGADKAWARAIVAGEGVRVPQAQVLRAGEAATLAPPLVVKPVDADNSAGLSLVTTASQLPGALAEAFSHGTSVLVERYIAAGREVRCGVLDLGEGPVALPLEEYRLRADHPIRRQRDKLGDGGDGALRLMAKSEETAWIVDPDDPITAATQQAALRCYAALGCRDYGLFDFRIDPGGEPWFIEAGLYCSFAEQSVVATMARAAGWATADLFAAFVAVAARQASGRD